MLSLMCLMLAGAEGTGNGAPPEKPKKPKRKKPEPVYQRVLARFDFNDKEVRELGGEAGRLNQEINQIKEDAKSAAADFKSRVDHKQAALNAVSVKLTNGYEMRETMAEVKYFPKQRKKRLFEKGTRRLIREDEMTQADFELPLFKKKEMDATKTKPAEPKSDAGKAAAGKPSKKEKKKTDAVLEAIIEAAKLQTKVEFDLSQALTEFEHPKKLVAAWKKAAKASKWDKTVADNLCKIVLAEGIDKGMTEAVEVLRPFCVTD